MENALALINLLLILMAVLFIFLVILVIDTLQNRKVLVKRTSTKYAGMQELNDVFAFSPIKEKVYLHKDCNSKSQFDRQQEYDYLVSLTRDSPAWLEEIIYQAERNRILFEEYSERAAKLEPTSKEIIASLRTLMGVNRYRRLEDQACAETMQHPVVKTDVVVTVSYTSEKGKKHYEKQQVFGIDDQRKALGDANRQIAYRQTREYQRSLMTDSLRYDVMRRDGFRCCLCGAARSDGAKLEVDHIVPVSRGGKTEMSNLRTLCERCNRGKRDHYDPNGPN